MREGRGLDAAGVFHEIPRIDDARLAELFAREVLSFLVGLELLSPVCSQAQRGEARAISGRSFADDGFRPYSWLL